MMMGMIRSIVLTAKRLVTRRSPKWPAAERAHKQKEPLCQWCGGTEDVQVHHIVPYHIDKTKELDPENFISLCMAPAKCHYLQGHRGTSWNDYDPDIRRKCREHAKRQA